MAKMPKLIMRVTLDKKQVMKVLKIAKQIDEQWDTLKKALVESIKVEADEKE